MLKLHIHPQARPWLPPPSEMAKIKALFKNTKADVYFHPRSKANEILGRHAEPYAFRAFTRGEEVNLFVDETETPQSIAWLLAHELTHRMVHDSPTLDQAFEEARPTDLDPAGDPFHDIDPEERFCDGIATNLLGYRTDRSWWRKRTPPVSRPSTSFGAAPIAATRAQKVFYRAQQILVREMDISPGAFQAVHRGGAFEIHAPAPITSSVVRAVEQAKREIGASNVAWTESKASPGHIGEGWSIRIRES